MQEMIVAVGFAAVVAAWDIARRHYRARSGYASESIVKLDDRVRVLESGQREIVQRISNTPHLSRFQRKA